MKELIERAEKLGYKVLFNISLHNHNKGSLNHLFLADIQRWLREDKGIIVIIYFTENEEYYSVIYIISNKYISTNSENVSLDYETFEQALEEGIKKAFEILEK